MTLTFHLWPWILEISYAIKFTYTGLAVRLGQCHFDNCYTQQRTKSVHRRTLIFKRQEPDNYTSSKRSASIAYRIPSPQHSNTMSHVDRTAIPKSFANSIPTNPDYAALMVDNPSLCCSQFKNESILRQWTQLYKETDVSSTSLWLVKINQTRQSRCFKRSKWIGVPLFLNILGRYRQAGVLLVRLIRSPETS